jgi:hypothetical protein
VHEENVVIENSSKSIHSKFVFYLVTDLAKNINALGVSKREQELRDQMKQNHETKKQKDKDDREKQKQKVVDRKDSEKKRTQKGEKRR